MNDPVTPADRLLLQDLHWKLLTCLGNGSSAPSFCMNLDQNCQLGMRERGSVCPGLGVMDQAPSTSTIIQRPSEKSSALHTRPIHPSSHCPCASHALNKFFRVYRGCDQFLNAVVLPWKVALLGCPGMGRCRREGKRLPKGSY